MPLSKQEWLALEKKAHELRRLCLDTTYWAGSGHIGGGMSVMDMLTVLYHKYMRLDVKNPKWEDRDRFILSKGHAGIAYAPVLVDFGWNDPEQLKTFNHTNSKMGIHLDSNKVVGVDASTGSLGHGLPIAVGTALAARVLGKDYKTYCILGDGECDEGQVWEAAQFAAHYKLDNLVCFVDDNKYQLDGAVDKVMSHGKGIGAKFDAFGWNVIELQDGNDVEQIYDAVQLAYDTKGVPTCIVLNTVKGLGATFAEPSGAHSSQPTKEQWDEAIAAAEKKLAEIKAQ